MDTLPFDTTNQEMRNAYELIAKTNKSFFLTGRAGTGKTTFLQQVQSCVEKRFVVLAPSGVAAINAGGQTIHSFFGFDLGVQGPRSFGRMISSHIEVVRNVDTIIIDEVSMVRCDIVDAIERMLRFCRRSSAPFGGVQMIFVGDLFQLPPIAKKEDQDTLRRIYGSSSYYFFHARCLRDMTLAKIELQKIYRQSDHYFIGLLDHFRTGDVSFSDLMEINKRVFSADEQDEDSAMRITLTAYRDGATNINAARLSELPGDAFSYTAINEGNTERLKDAVDDILDLKEGAQVMFLRNDLMGRWANGTIAKVYELSEKSISVCLENGMIVEVEREMWEAFEYEYDEKLKICKKTVVGKVTQYPLRLAWAVTIHKSQSLTFDNIDIDFGRGAFTCGQAYVALSRARSLKGLRLVSPIGFNSVRVSSEILTFATSFNDERIIADEINVGQAIRDHEDAGDLDGASKLLFDLCDKEAHIGRIRYAYELLNRAMSYVADDSCLFGRAWKLLPNDSTESIMLNAAGLLYSGCPDECIRLLSSVVSTTPEFFNGLYLMARALELKEEWDTVETFYNQMIAVFRETTDSGLDSPSFRKLKYRVAILNETHFGESGIDIMADLIGEIPNYDTYHVALRKMLISKKSELQKKEDVKNPLMSQMLDESISDDMFLASLKREYSRRTKDWRQYLESVEMVSRAIVYMETSE